MKNIWQNHLRSQVCPFPWCNYCEITHDTSQRIIIVWIYIHMDPCGSRQLHMDPCGSRQLHMEPHGWSVCSPSGEIETLRGDVRIVWKTGCEKLSLNFKQCQPVYTYLVVDLVATRPHLSQCQDPSIWVQVEQVGFSRLIDDTVQYHILEENRASCNGQSDMDHSCHFGLKSVGTWTCTQS